MAWVVCCSCHHYAEVKPLPRGAKLKCSNCQAKAVRTVRQLKTSMLNGGQMPADVARVLTHAALVSIANHRGYKPGWAAAKFKAIYGYWPDNKPEPQNPSGELLWWIRQGNKKFARMMADKEANRCPIKAETASTLMTDADIDTDWR